MINDYVKRLRRHNSRISGLVYQHSQFRHMGNSIYGLFKLVQIFFFLLFNNIKKSQNSLAYGICVINHKFVHIILSIPFRSKFCLLSFFLIIMSCLRFSQAVCPMTSRNEQVNRVVVRQTSNNQTFTVCISFFLIITILLFLKIYLFKRT